LLVFDDGNFNEDNTFSISEVFRRNPIEVLPKDLAAPTTAFADLPPDQLYIFPGTRAPPDLSSQTVTGPAGPIPRNGSFNYHFSAQPPMMLPGGSVKILDPITFPIAKQFSVALVTLKPGAMREVHWHTTSDEWNYFLAGRARVTVMIARAASRTFDFSAGDVGFVPVASTHYVENTGDVDVVFLEVLRADHFSDVALGQWLAMTPSHIVKDTLNLSNETISGLHKEKQWIALGNANLTLVAATNGTA
jgi:oxalate decarboxylase family bicupin protein